MAGGLVVLASLSFVAAGVAVWARALALNTDRWVETVGPLIRDPEVVESLSRRLSATIVEGLDVEERVARLLASAEGLPQQAQLLAAPAASAVRERLQARLEALLRTEQAERLWVEANRAAHQAIVSILRGDLPGGLDIEDGTVTLDVVELISLVLAASEDLLSDILDRPVSLPSVQEIQASGTPDRARALLESRLGLDLPEDFGEIVVFQDDRLASAQQAVRLLDGLATLLVVLTVLLVGAALAVSVRRRRTIVHLAIGLLLGAVAVRIAIRAIENAIVEAARAQVRGAVSTVVTAAFGRLLDFTMLVFLGGILVILVVHIVGQPDWLGRLWGRSRAVSASARTKLGPWVATRLSALRLGGVVVGALLLFFLDISWQAAVLLTAAVVVYELGLTYLAGWTVREGSGTGTGSG